jgi:hypothetical protein
VTSELASAPAVGTRSAGWARTTRIRRQSPWRNGVRVLAGLAFAVLLAVVWLVATALHARGELTAARAAVPGAVAEVKAGGGAGAPSVVELADRARNAYDDTHNVVWAAAAALPGVGGPLTTVRGLTEATHQVASGALLPMAVALQEVHPADLLRNGTVDVDAVRRADAPLTAAAVVLDQQRLALDRLDDSWLPQVAAARRQLRDALDPLADTAVGAATAVHLIPPMLGADEPRRYFVGFQNPAEARGTGGLLGAFALVRADRGKLTIERMGSDNQLPPFSVTPAGLSPSYLAQYGAQGAASMWLNSNLSPHFPEVAAAWGGMWTAATGQPVDGAIALDPKALAAILRSTGPVSAPGVGTVAAGTVEQLVLLGEYQLQSDPTVRKRLMVGVGSATLQALLHGQPNFTALTGELAKVTKGRGVMLYSAVADEQNLLDANGLTGAVDQTGRPFAQAVVVNAGGNKLDTWLHEDLTYSAVRCDASQRVVDISVSLRNDAPRSGLPVYVTVRSDKPPYKTVVGQSRVELQVLTTIGGRLVKASLDGLPVTPAPAPGTLPKTLPDGPADAPFLDVGAEGGHPAFGLDLELRPGATRTVVLRVAEAASTPAALAPLLPLQPLANTPTAHSEMRGCGHS